MFVRPGACQDRLIPHRGGHEMTTALKTTVRRLFDAIDGKDWAAAKELTSPTCRVRAGGHDLDREAWLGMGQMFAAAFPDGRHEVVGMIAEGDQVAVRAVWQGTHQGAFQGIPATGRAVKIDVVM